MYDVMGNRRGMSFSLREPFVISLLLFLLPYEYLFSRYEYVVSTLIPFFKTDIFFLKCNDYLFQADFFFQTQKLSFLVHEHLFLSSRLKLLFFVFRPPTRMH